MLRGLSHVILAKYPQHNSMRSGVLLCYYRA